MQRQIGKGSMLVMLLMLAFAACTGDPGSKQQSNWAGTAKEVRLPLLPPSQEGNAAAAVGRLQLNGPCLYLLGADGSRLLPAFITFDTDWESGRLRIGARSFAPGDRVTLGGGEHQGGPESLSWVQPPHPTCDTRRMWITVSVNES